MSAWADPQHSGTVPSFSAVHAEESYDFHDREFQCTQSNMASLGHQSYGVKGDPDSLSQRLTDYFQNSLPALAQQKPAPALDTQEQDASLSDLPVTDMDLAGFLEMDDKTLTELAGGVNTTEWNSLFNGQLDGFETLDPMTGIQSSGAAMHANGSVSGSPGMVGNPNDGNVDRWLVEETHKLERQQKIQQQKLLELQQTLLKTEILKNQLQIASISSQSTNSSSLVSGVGGNFNFNPSVGGPLVRGAGASHKLPHQHTLQSTSPSAVSLSNSGSGRGGGMSTSTTNNDSGPCTTIPSAIPPLKLAPMPSVSSPPPFDDGSEVFEPDKRKVHNLIEKKYRSSINDRIGVLRDIVTKHSKDNKKLQKSAVLQKTIDYINHLHNIIRKLQDENRQLKESLARANGQVRPPSYSSPPATPHNGLSLPSSCESVERDSGHSSPDDYLSDTSHGSSPPQQQHSNAVDKMSFLASHLLQGTVGQYLMVVMLVAIFFINPLSFTPSVRQTSKHGGMRALNSLELDDDNVGGDQMMDMVIYFGFWALRIFIAAVCFGWMTLKSMPKVVANSQDAVRFWRYRKQAENELQKGEFVKARENLEAALTVTSRPIPTSYYGIITGLLWSLFCHVLFQLVIGQWAVSLASMFISNSRGRGNVGGGGSKKTGFGVNFADVSETYHLLHQINMASIGAAHLHGMGFYLALNALNFAEADRPFGKLSRQQLAKMFFTLGLQCHFSIPYGSGLPMWYYYLCFCGNLNLVNHATSLKWAVTPEGRKFLMSSQWATEVKLGSRLHQGTAALPAYSVTRAFCKELLCETFTALLLPDNNPDNPTSSDCVLGAFKHTFNLAKEANADILGSQDYSKLLGAAVSTSDSGFSAIQWWASVGIVACYWSAGEDSRAEDYYPFIEATSGDGAAVSTVLQLAFKAYRMHKRPNDSVPAPLDVMLQLCAMTSNSLQTAVNDLLQDRTTSSENELNQLGLLLASDWVLNLRLVLWENRGKDESVSLDICPGFYQDLESLSKLATLLPSASSRLRLYKGCYQLMAGSNPMAAQALLCSTGRASLLRRRAKGVDADRFANPALYSHEHAMAKLVAYKHLPPSLELPDSTPPPAPVPSPKIPTGLMPTTPTSANPV